MHDRKLAGEGTGQVFMSDTVLVALMCAPRSVYSWDVLITKADGKLFFDTREGYSLGTLTVRQSAAVGRFCMQMLSADACNIALSPA